MPTLRDRSTRAAVAVRLDRLLPTAPPRWGRMTAPQMLAHLNDAIDMAFGDRPVPVRNLPLARTWLMKQLIFHVLPFPKNVPSAKEITTRVPDAFEVERQRLTSQMERMDAAITGVECATHPIFGKLTLNEWGTLGYRHTDHHLRQFGV